MNISLNWLSSHLDLTGKSVSEISDLFTFAGVEVESIQTKGISSEKIVVAQIKEAVQHENADKLKVTQVDAGEGQLRQIVCGAKNYQVGDKVPCCLPGADLGGFVIGETKMRGIESKGMLAAAEEVGLPKGEDGLLILPADSPIGTPVKTLFDSDTLLELEVTPNRPDLLSHSGMARELATLLEIAPKTAVIEPLTTTLAAADEITVENTEACPIYSLTRIDGIKVSSSPDWLKQRLESIGLSPINNIVDITNYVLHETGQPLHAFDAAKLSGGIVVRNASQGETFVALDETKHQLDEDALVISDSSKSVLALAGVMGGLESGVTEATTSILLESAYFQSTGIRKTSRKTAISSDSSYRFERGSDPQAVVNAASLAIKLIKEFTATSCENPIEIKIMGSIKTSENEVILDYTKLDQLTGSSIPHTEASSILERLGLGKINETEGSATFSIPSFRQDLTRHIDLVEEIVRVKGLAAIPSSFSGTFVTISAADQAHDADMTIRRTLAALGLNECQTIKLISETQVQDALTLRPMMDTDLIQVKSPLSEDHAVMRPSIVPGLIAVAERNSRQLAKSLRFFEMGRVFRNAGGGKAKDQESDVLSILISGEAQPTGWSTSERIVDYFDLKAIVSALVPNKEISLKVKDREGFALSSEIKANGQNIGIIARISPARERSLALQKPTFVAEIDLGKLRKISSAIAQIENLPQYPGSTRDAAMELPIDTPNAKIETILEKANEPLLVISECFDVFSDSTGKKISVDKKSIAYRFLYRDPAKTLKSAEVDAAHARILKALEKIEGLSYR